uniref:EGF-like domain-containing protein n=1 Tax=Magallana gigas TaxID=29159 RepID=A0A8W8JUS8_MAGGI
MSISTPLIPSFLAKYIKAECQVYGRGEGMLRCGKSDVYIKPECVCSFHHVYDASKYHSYSSCPQGDELDVVTQLKCPDCFRYSLNNKGPCINGGNLTCKGDEVAPAITCKCPPNYQGMFCEEKMENVTRLCDRILTSSADTLMNCDYTKQECVTFSRNRRYAFKCYETDISQIKGELPLCKDTEDITVQPVVNDVSYWVVPKDATTVRVGSPSAAEIHISIPLLTVILLTLQL